MQFDPVLYTSSDCDMPNDENPPSNPDARARWEQDPLVSRGRVTVAYVTELMSALKVVLLCRVPPTLFRDKKWVLVRVNQQKTWRADTSAEAACNQCPCARAAGNGRQNCL